MTIKLGLCLDCDKQLTTYDAFPGSHAKGRHMVPYKMRHHWCRKCWCRFSSGNRSSGRAARGTFKKVQR